MKIRIYTVDGNWQETSTDEKSLDDFINHSMVLEDYLMFVNPYGEKIYIPRNKITCISEIKKHESFAYANGKKIKARFGANKIEDDSSND